MIEMWQHAFQAVSHGDRAVLVMVVDHEGSVPGTTGAALVVTDTGVVGTVGGGVAEHEIIGQAQTFSGRPELVDVEHTPEASGSLCSGRHTMVIMALQPESLPAIEAIVDTLSKHRAGVLELSHEGIEFTSGSSGPIAFSTGASKPKKQVPTQGRRVKRTKRSREGMPSTADTVGSRSRRRFRER